MDPFDPAPSIQMNGFDAITFQAIGLTVAAMVLQQIGRCMKREQKVAPLGSLTSGLLP